MSGSRTNGRRPLTPTERETAAEWREFDHKQKLRDATEQLDADTSVLRLGPATRSEPGAGRTVRVTVPGRERVTRTRTELVAIEDSRAVYQVTELLVPETREVMEWGPRRDGNPAFDYIGRQRIARLPRRWTEADVLGWLLFARAAIAASTRGDGPSIKVAPSSLTRMMVDCAEPQASLVNSRWIPSAADISVATWIINTWLPLLTNRVERVAVALHVRGVSLRKIGPACGFAAGGTNHTKAVIQKGLWRIGCKLDVIGPEAWPRLQDLRFVLDETH